MLALNQLDNPSVHSPISVANSYNQNGDDSDDNMQVDSDSDNDNLKDDLDADADGDYVDDQEPAPVSYVPTASSSNIPKRPVGGSMSSGVVPF